MYIHNSAIFDSVPTINVPRSKFDLSHTHLTTFDSDYVIPIYCEEVLPGDTFHIQPKIFARLNTLQKPIMDTLWLETAFFYVPNRVLWTNFTRMMGEKDAPTASIDFSFPIITSGTEASEWYTHSIHDYIGLPVGVAGLEARSDWHRAYYQVWNDWIRNQNLQDALNVPRDDGPDSNSMFELQRINKKADKFTRGLPEPQEGDPVTIPLGTTAPVVGTGDAVRFINGNALEQPFNLAVSGTAYTGFGFPATTTGASIEHWADAPANSAKAMGLPLTGTTGLVARLDQSVAATVNDLRFAFMMQSLLEILARGGHRYVELVASLYGTVCPDYRVQRSEYLGGTRDVVNISIVPQTAPDSRDESFIGSLGAYGHCAVNGDTINKSFFEHGVILGVMWVRGENRYDHGLDAKFNRRTRFDIYMPPLAQLGEQPVYNKELYAQGTSDDDEILCYNEAWIDYRMKQNRVSGLFRMEPVDQTGPISPLDTWHLMQDLDSLPTFGPGFIQSDVPLDRVVQVPAEPHFNAEILINCYADRPLPTRSIPYHMSNL